MSTTENLLSGSVSDMCNSYSELNEHQNGFSIQLIMFKEQLEYNSLQEAQQIMKSMCEEVRVLFSCVEKLIRLLLLCHAT